MKNNIFRIEHGVLLGLKDNIRCPKNINIPYYS